MRLDARMRSAAWAGVIVVAAIAGGSVAFAAGNLGPAESRSLLPMAPFIVVLCLIVSVVVVVRSAIAHRDLFHPLAFPAVYVGVASLAPVLYIAAGGDLGYMNAGVVDSRAPVLVSLGIIGFIAGAGLPIFRRRRRDTRPFDRTVFSVVGRVLLLVPLGLASRDLAAGVIVTRGLGQSSYTMADSVNAMAALLAPLAVACILIGRYGRRRLLTVVDIALVGALLIALGLNGRRAAALAVMLVIVMFLTLRSRSKLWGVAGVGGILMFAYLVVSNRMEATNESFGTNPAEPLLRDLGSVAFTTGLTDRYTAEPLGGSTLLVALARQVPNPFSSWVFGAPVDSGAFVFREYTGTSDSAGYGFSLIAEGVLNFGVTGAFALPFFVGVAFAWAYARSDLAGGRASNFVYLFMVATLPFAWRSDVLGAVKGVLYPVLAVAVVFILARTAWTYRGRRGRGAVENSPDEAQSESVPADERSTEVSP